MSPDLALTGNRTTPRAGDRACG